MDDTSHSAQVAGRGADLGWMRPWLTSFALPGRLRAICWLGLGLLLALVQGTPPSWALDNQRLMAAATAQGERAVAAARSLQAALPEWAVRSEAARVESVNDFVNQRVIYRSDLDLWGQVDYWASPLETLQRGAGDCEDFAIAKYFALVASGVPDRKLRLVYVRAVLDGMVQPHMVLAYYPSPNVDPWVLDSLVPQLKRAPERTDLTPVFSFNAEGIWEGVGSTSVRGSPSDRLSRWGEVLRKAHLEGFR